MPWNEVAATGDGLATAASALGTALGATPAAEITNMVCTKNEVSGVWTCVVLKYTMTP